MPDGCMIGSFVASGTLDDIWTPLKFLSFFLQRCRASFCVGIKLALGEEMRQPGIPRDRLGGRIRPPRFFINNVRDVTGIGATLGTPLRTSILRLSTKVWTIFSKTS